MRYLGLASTALLAAACSNAAPHTAPSPPASAAPPEAPAPAASAAAPPRERSCGALGCRLYSSAREAMQAVLADRPLIVAFGEAHAQKGSEDIPSSAKRFTTEMLPLLQGRASDLIVEILAPPRGCDAKTKEVKKRQAPVVERQASSNQDEYLAMGDAARALGIAPDLLRPTCADFERITKAPRDEVIPVMLEMIKRVSVTQVRGLLARADRDPEKMIVLYGGAFHGEPDPLPHRAPWSFAADLTPAVKGRYVAVHLFVPEAISDDEDTWKTFPWYAHYDKRAHPDDVTLFHPRPDAYVLIFPVTKGGAKSE